MKKTTKKLYLVLAASLLSFLPNLAFADNLTDESDEFGNSQAIDNKELDTMRGGFYNPVTDLFEDFNFIGITQVANADLTNITTNITSVSFADLQAMAAAGDSMNAILEPTLIQNSLDGATIYSLNAVNMTVNMLPAVAQALAVSQFNNNVAAQ